MGDIIIVEELPSGGFCHTCVTWGETVNPAGPHVRCPACNRPCTGQSDGVIGATQGDDGRMRLQTPAGPLRIPSKWAGRPDGAPPLYRRFAGPSVSASVATPPTPPQQSRQQKRAEARKNGRHKPRRY